MPHSQPISQRSSPARIALAAGAIVVMAYLAIPRFIDIAAMAQQTEARTALKQIAALEEIYRAQTGAYSAEVDSIRFSPPPGARYLYSLTYADADSFRAIAVSTFDEDGDGSSDVWVITDADPAPVHLLED